MECTREELHAPPVFIILKIFAAFNKVWYYFKLEIEIEFIFV